MVRQIIQRIESAIIFFFDLAMYFKIIHKLVDLNVDDFFVWSHGGVRLRAGVTISSWN